MFKKALIGAGLCFLAGAAVMYLIQCRGCCRDAELDLDDLDDDDEWVPVEQSSEASQTASDIKSAYDEGEAIPPVTETACGSCVKDNCEGCDLNDDNTASDIL